MSLERLVVTIIGAASICLFCTATCVGMAFGLVTGRWTLPPHRCQP